jgi:hypothetical protein
MLLIVELETMFNTKFVGMCMIYFHTKIRFHASFQDPRLSGTIVAPTSQVGAAAMLVLPIV